tara:strand:- start:4020 stop:5651 length:1632 start_codon:yes stop_codon:yes gene_type:complete
MIALYPGAYKPPHRGHFNVVKSLLDNSYNGSVYNKDNYKETGAELLKGRSNKKPKIDKVLVFVGAGERNGITKEESMSIWNIYSKYLGNVEILDGGSNPMFAAKDYAQANPELEFVSVTGIRGDKDFVDLRRVTTFKNAPNVSGLALAAEPGSGIRATDFRNTILSGNLDKVLDFFPQDLSREEISAVLADLKDKIVSEILADNIEGYINNYFNKEDTINEIGDLSQEPYKWSAFTKPKDSSDPYTYYDFNTDNGTKYQVIFNREEFGKTVNYDMSFVAKGKDGKGFSADALTGDNEPLKIMSTIVDITREQIKKAGDVEFITFEPTKGKAGEEGAKGNTRSKLYKIIIKKNFPKANVSGTDTVVVDMSAYLGNNLEEEIVGDKIECDNCDWSWDIKSGGDDLHICHKCGHDNAGTHTKELELKDYITSLTEYMIDQGINITPLPEVKLRKDEENASNFFGRTAYYDPNNREVVLYITGRHDKDIARSFSHEMIHHMQNLQGSLHSVQTQDTNADSALLDLEKEAYLLGNITFRNWEDNLKNS